MASCRFLACDQYSEVFPPVFICPSVVRLDRQINGTYVLSHMLWFETDPSPYYGLQIAHRAPIDLAHQMVLLHGIT